MKLFQGDPIKPYVDKLMEGLSTKPGEVHHHRDIAHMAGVTYPSNKYRSLIVAWRKRLMSECNIDLDIIIDVGYRVLEENERVVVGSKNFRASVRHMEHSLDRIASAETAKLDDNHRRQQDHAVRLVELVKAGKQASRQLSTIGKIQVLPRADKNSA